MGTAGAYAELVGRQAEIALLSELARQARAGRGGVALIEGEPGIGKTALLDVLERECAGLGMRLARGAAEDFEQRLPFAAVGECLGLRGSGEAGASRAAALLRGEESFGESTAAVNHEMAVTEAILELVDGWCAAGPVAIIVDDAQWADPASVVVLDQLARAAAEQPLLLVIALRVTPRRDDIGALARSRAGARLLSLGPLDEPGVDQLVRGLLGAPAGPALRRLLAGAGGNPLYILEVVAALSRQREIAGQVPQSLADVVMRRWELLPRKAGETLQLAAVLGATVNAAELSATLDISPAEVFETIRIATDAGLLAEAGGQVVFRHDLIREAAAGRVPASVRAALHLRASEVLRTAGAPAERVGEHLAAGAAMDRTAIDWL
ncbi:ATP-binding protein, partial [Allorhizocola rhizosphaerae]|uniref:ATP-binding protein n=1 Tax=Allorhizocola rhizosphaerae TaxID=1872709 RepID=UPI0013C30ABF